MSDVCVTTEPATMPEIRVRVRIRYCTQCRWLMRAQWLAGGLQSSVVLGRLRTAIVARQFAHLLQTNVVEERAPVGRYYVGPHALSERYELVAVH